MVFDIYFLLAKCLIMLASRWEVIGNKGLFVTDSRTVCLTRLYDVNRDTRTHRAVEMLLERRRMCATDQLLHASADSVCIARGFERNFSAPGKGHLTLHACTHAMLFSTQFC